MGEQIAERIEAAVDHIAATLVGLATGSIGYRAASPFHLPSFLAAASAFIVGFGVAALTLKAVARPQPRYELPVFELKSFPEFEPELDELLLTERTELVLTDDDRLDPPPRNDTDELILDDILAKIGPGARVVRLFDPGPLPTPGQLKSKIDRHLQSETRRTPHDASQALHEALAELRRSLG